MSELSDEQIDRLIHQAFFLALQVIYTAHDIEPGDEQRVWDLLQEVPDWETTVQSVTAAVSKNPEQYESANEIIARDRMMAQAILRDQDACSMGILTNDDTYRYAALMVGRPRALAVD